VTPTCYDQVKAHVGVVWGEAAPSPGLVPPSAKNDIGYLTHLVRIPWDVTLENTMYFVNVRQWDL
jgi:hypothetical protein